MTQNQQLERLTQIVLDDAWMMQILRYVYQVDKPDLWIGAGFVRNKVWDHLHGFDVRTEYDDIDVIYFDASCTDKQQDFAIEQWLKQQDKTLVWSVKNQARMHLKHGHQCYQNTIDAISYWVETATCIAVRLNQNEQLEFIAPVGLDDLFALKVSKNPRSTIDHAGFIERVSSKQWLEKWPQLVVI